MRRYTKELIQEMEEAVRISRKLKKRLECDDRNNSFMGKNAFNLRARHYGNPLKLEDIIGIPSEVLPPDHLITAEEKARLSRIMEELLEIWNFHPEFPDSLPDRLKYKHLKKVWASEQVYLGMGENKIEFCNYDQNNCPFPQHCTFCDDIMEQEKLYNRLMQSRFNQGGNNKSN